MFSYIHETSITVSNADYAKLPEADQTRCEAKSDKSGYWLRIPTEMNLPETSEEIADLCEGMLDKQTEMRFGEKTVVYPTWFKYAVVGWKLEINQSVQRDRKDGSKTEIRAKTTRWYAMQGATATMDLIDRLGAATTPSLAKAKDVWLDELYEKNAAAIDALK